ncbi:hypothetical protein SDC9_170685 [bioreactor metagenome]|uniref:Uncharacterized protein n=1 Tax=bioreactor metagenome TaxID=1076179 RepID=A0A645G8S3_9ZZZZ
MGLIVLSDSPAYTSVFDKSDASVPCDAGAGLLDVDFAHPAMPTHKTRLIANAVILVKLNFILYPPVILFIY